MSVPLVEMSVVVGTPWLSALPEGSMRPSREAEVCQEGRALPCLRCSGRARRKLFPAGRRGRRFDDVGVRTEGGPKPTSKCCVTLSWMVMQGEHTGVYPGSGKRRPYVQQGGEVCISLHRGARVGVTSRRERVSSPSLKEKKGERWLLEMLISCFSLFGRVVGCFVRPSPSVEPWPTLL
jgi:hypothetical protein